MGLFGNILGGLLGGGAGVAGAHNAHLAELAIKKLSHSDKKRVADKVIEMSVRASGYRVTAEDFCNLFNKQERPCQLNFSALALAQLDIHPVAGDSWMGVRNPFTMNINSEDLRVNSYHFLKKHKLEVSVGTERIDINKWAREKDLLAEQASSSPGISGAKCGSVSTIERMHRHTIDKKESKKNKRILLVDDEEAVHLLCREEFEEEFGNFIEVVSLSLQSSLLSLAMAL